MSERNVFIADRNNRAGISFDKNPLDELPSTISSKGDILLDGALIEKGRTTFNPEVCILASRMTL